jgi:urease accessory protein
MCAATSPSDTTTAAAVGGVAEVGFARRDGTTRLSHLHQHEPLRVLFPRTTAPEVPVAVLVNTAGGLVGGDHLEVRAVASEGSAAMVTSQAAEKVYRSAGPDCLIDVGITVGPSAWLEWLPQETILFDGARLRRRTAVDVAPSGRLMAAEMLVFGRAARHERLTHGLIRDAWEIRHKGRLVWTDILHMADDLGSLLDDPACFDGAGAVATFVHVADDATERLPLARDLLPVEEDAVRAGATVINGVLVARWLAREALPLRAAFGAFWAAFRSRGGGLPAGLPRLWHI